MERDKILIIEDVEINRTMLASMFEKEYTILEAENGKEGIELFAKYYDSLAIVLLDLMMPVMDGMKVMELLHKKQLTLHVPIIMVTGDTSVESEEKGYDLGVVDFIHKPYHEPVVKRIVQNSIDLFNYKERLEQLVKQQTSKLEEQNQLLLKQTQKLQHVNEAMIDTMSNIVEFRDLESGQHTKRIRAFSRILAEEMMTRYPEYKLTPEKVDIITQASAVHDIGKIMIPDSILLKPARLTKDEFEIMKSHTTKGSEMIESLSGIDDAEFLDCCYDICRHHHERYDGKGYPDQLTGDEISIASQIVGVADVYDALATERIYKEAYDKETSYTMIMNGECGTFSPKIMTAFTVSKSKFEEQLDLYAEHTTAEEDAEEYEKTLDLEEELKADLFNLS